MTIVKTDDGKYKTYIDVKNNISIFKEEGGAYTVDGYILEGQASIIAGPHGEKKKPLYIKTHNVIPNDVQAVFEMKKGDYIIEAFQGKGKIIVEIYKVLTIYIEGRSGHAILELKNKFIVNKDIKLNKSLYPAVSAAIEKTACYNCKHMHYGITPNKLKN
jgi:hypothetical protein